MNLVPVVAFTIAIVRGYHPDGMELLGAVDHGGRADRREPHQPRQDRRRPVSAAWADTRSANPAKSRA